MICLFKVNIVARVIALKCLLMLNPQLGYDKMTLKTFSSKSGVSYVKKFWAGEHYAVRSMSDWWRRQRLGMKRNSISVALCECRLTYLWFYAYCYPRNKCFCSSTNESVLYVLITTPPTKRSPGKSPTQRLCSGLEKMCRINRNLSLSCSASKPELIWTKLYWEESLANKSKTTV